VPGGQCAGDEVGRDFDFFAQKAFDAADAGGGVFVPPAGEPIERGGEIGFALRVVERGSFGPGTGTQVEDLFNQLDEVVDAEVAYRVFDRRGTS